MSEQFKQMMKDKHVTAPQYLPLSLSLVYPVVASVLFNSLMHVGEGCRGSEVYLCLLGLDRA